MFYKSKKRCKHMSKDFSEAGLTMLRFRHSLKNRITGRFITRFRIFRATLINSQVLSTIKTSAKYAVLLNTSWLTLSIMTCRFYFQEIMIELYKKNVWHDAKTVNAISQACLRKETKVSHVNFFKIDFASFLSRNEYEWIVQKRTEGHSSLTEKRRKFDRCSENTT